jgi:hypothetical protein
MPAIILRDIDREFLLKAAMVPGEHQAIAQRILKAECERLEALAQVAIKATVKK